MANILLVGFGGFVGSVLRFLVGGVVQQTTKSIDLPFGTLAVNVVGCFVIGFLAQLAEGRGVFTSESRAFVFIGILGGFTTFSSFGNEMLNLAHEGQMMNALANVGVNEDLPIVIEIVDTKEKLESFLELIDPHIKAGLSRSKRCKSNFIEPTKTDHCLLETV